MARLAGFHPARDSGANHSETPIMTDPVTEECRRVREQIVERSGGFDGYFDQLEELDRQRLA